MKRTTPEVYSEGTSHWLVSPDGNPESRFDEISETGVRERAEQEAHSRSNETRRHSRPKRGG